MIRATCVGLILTTLPGCGTLINLTSGPMVMGGSRTDNHFQEKVHSLNPKSNDPHDALSQKIADRKIAAWDIPFSFMLDMGLLPITLLAELSRWITGWPPKAECRAHGGF